MTIEGHMKTLIQKHCPAGKSALYIGFRHGSSWWWYDYLKSIGFDDVVILEVYDKNVEGLRQDGRCAVIQGDVRDVDKFFSDKQFDLVMWLHGPEHLEQEELPDVFEKLRAITRSLLSLTCPRGPYPQDALYGNPYEVHRSTLYEDFFTNLGFETFWDGEPSGGQIHAWRVKQQIGQEGAKR